MSNQTHKDTFLSSYCFKIIVRYPDLRSDEELLFSFHQIKQIKETIDKAISNFVEEKNIKDITSLKSKNWETKMIDIFVWKCYFGGGLNSEEINEELVWCLSDNRNYFKDKTDSFKKLDILDNIANVRMSEKIIALTEICISKRVSYHLICHIMSFYPLD